MILHYSPTCDDLTIYKDLHAAYKLCLCLRFTLYVCEFGMMRPSGSTTPNLHWCVGLGGGVFVCVHDIYNSYITYKEDVVGLEKGGARVHVFGGMQCRSAP